MDPFVFVREMKFVSIFISFSPFAPEIKNTIFFFLLNYIHQKVLTKKTQLHFHRLEIAFIVHFLGAAEVLMYGAFNCII